MSNSTMNEQEESPWASLEAEFEEQPATERVAITTGTPNRQRTFRVAGALSLFSGYSPAVVLTVLATFMGLANVYQKFASVIGIAQAVLLAWIVSVIFRDPHRGPVFHAVLGLLAAGTVELSLAFSVWSAESSLRPAPLSLVDFLISLQKQMESFYRFEHWIVYLVVAPLIGFLAFKIRRRSPWMDLPLDRARADYYSPVSF